MASVLGGAISGIAVGAGTGAIGALISGGNLWDGIKKGAIMGGITGGVMGAVGAVGPDGILAKMGVGPSGASAAAPGTAAPVSLTTPISPLTPINAVPTINAPVSGLGQAITGVSDVGSAASSVAPITTSVTPNAISGVANAAPLGSVTDAIPNLAPINAVPQVVPTAGANVAVPGAPGTGFFNSPYAPMMVGNVIQGLGGALTGAADAKASASARRERAASYDVDPSSLFSLNGTVNSGLPTAQEKYGYAPNGYYMDPKSGRILPKG